MHRRKRVTGRFWVFLTVVAVLIGVLIWKLGLFGTKQAVLMMAESQTSMKLDVVYVRDEELYMATSVAEVDFTAEEGHYITQGSTVAHVFTTGYTENLLKKLDVIRENIEIYHEALLGNIIDTKLDALNDVVTLMGEEVRDLSRRNVQGSMYGAMRKLETAMSNRQSYMRQHQQSDSKLIQLYQEETSQLSSIASMRKTALATATGVVSFQIDGYEKDLTPSAVQDLTIDQVRTVLRGGELSNTREVRDFGLYRIVDQSDWYVAALYNGSSWTPVIDQHYGFVPEGYDDLMFDATVENVQKMSGTVLVIFRIQQPMGPMIYPRSGRGTFSINISGFSVPREAVKDVNGQTGVWVMTENGETFIEVDVLTSGAGQSIISPRLEDALVIGQAVLVK